MGVKVIYLFTELFLNNDRLAQPVYMTKSLVSEKAEEVSAYTIFDNRHFKKTFHHLR